MDRSPVLTHGETSYIPMDMPVIPQEQTISSPWIHTNYSLWTGQLFLKARPNIPPGQTNFSPETDQQFSGDRSTIPQGRTATVPYGQSNRCPGTNKLSSTDKLFTWLCRSFPRGQTSYAPWTNRLFSGGRPTITDEIHAPVPYTGHDRAQERSHPVDVVVGPEVGGRKTDDDSRSEATGWVHGSARDQHAVGTNTNLININNTLSNKD